MGTKPNILIVDDDQQFRKTLSDIFKAKGYAPETAATGKEALHSIKEQGFNVALIDLKLGDISGLEVIQEIKECSPNTQCILITGHASRESAIEAINLGAYSYVQKPYDMEHLLLTIQRAIEKQQAKKALREREATLKSIFRAAPTGIGMVADRVIKQVNQQLCEITGYSREELLEKSARIVYPTEEDFEFVGQEKYKQIRERGTGTVETRWQRKDGKVIDVLLSSTPIDPNDLSVGVTFTALDISERKQAEEMLRDSETRYKAITHYTNNGVAVYQAVDDGNDFVFIEFNKAAEEIEKIKGDDLIGKSVCEVFPGVKEFGLFEVFQRVWKTGNSEHFPITFYKDDRISGWRDNYVYKLDSGEIVAVYSDETKRKQAQEALQESEKRHRMLFENAPLGYQSLDKNGHLLEVNQAWLYTLGYTREEAIGKSFGDFVHADWKDHFKENFPRFKALDEITGVEFEIIKKDGSSILVSINGKIIRDEKGEFKQTHCIMHDVTRQRLSEDNLRKSEQRYRSLFEQSNDAIIIHDLNGRILDFNQRVSELLGYEREQLSSMLLKELHPEEELTSSKRAIKETREKGHTLFESRFKRADGSLVDVEISSRVTDPDKGTVQGIIRDISERKRADEVKKMLESQLQQAQKMEAIGTLAGGIAHDFNNILAPIIGCTEMSLEEVSTDTFLYENLQAVLNAGMRAKDLVQQILAFSRQADQELKPLRVQTIIKEVLKLSRSTLPTTIQIQQYISNQCGLVMADPTQIHQIAMNLITNAYHAMEETGGKLAVNLKEVELLTADFQDPDMIPGPYVCLTVSDTGMGMQKSVMDRIFDPYFTTKEKEKGTGLGLSVVHGIVKGFGGDISVHSEPGKETSFQVYLPVIKTRDEALEAEAIAPVLGGTEHILLVDDEDQVVRMVKQMLERLGYQITARTSSIEALEVFQEGPDQFDLIITDMTMPNMTGVQLAQKLIAVRSNIPIIICSGFSEKIDAQKAKVLGISGYVMKPVVRRELAKKVREALN